MAKKLKVGDIIRGYRITKVFGPGMMAISYAGAGAGRRKGLLQAVQVSGAERRLVPAVRRLSAGAVRARAKRKGSAFRGTPGRRVRGDVGRRLLFPGLRVRRERRRPAEDARRGARAAPSEPGCRPPRDPAVWARHVTWAKVFMSGIAALHESKIVHADLKPANVYLIKDPSIARRISAQADRHGLLRC